MKELAGSGNIALSDSPPQSSSSTLSSSSEEDEGEIPEAVEADILQVLLKIKSQDPAIYDENATLYSKDAAQLGPPPGRKRQKVDSKLYLKDTQAQEALQYGAEASDEEDDGTGGERALTFNSEQDFVRKEFLQAAKTKTGKEEALAGEEEEDLFNAVQHTKAQDLPELEEGSDKAGLKKLVDTYFGPNEALSAEDAFLKSFIANQAWRSGPGAASLEDAPRAEEEEEANQGGAGVGRPVPVLDDDEDAENLERADDFESAYNFRYEEPGSGSVATHPRAVAGSLRRPDGARQAKRRAKEAERAARAQRGAEAAKQQKNMKKEEIAELMLQWRKMEQAGVVDDASLNALVEGDFDPEEYDKKMQNVFGEDYYEMDDADDLSSVRAAEDGGEPVGAALRNGGAEAVADGSTPDSRLVSSELQRLVQEYYNLHYEDDIDGVKTRFRYRKVMCVWVSAARQRQTCLRMACLKD